MKFGRTNTDLDTINFAFPEMPEPGTNFIHQKVIGSKLLTIYLGTPAWSDKGFVGKIYPPKTKPVDFLYHYSRQFNCIEYHFLSYAEASGD